MLDNKEKAGILFFEKHMKQKEIADLLGISTSTLSEWLRKDKRYTKEKAKRMENNRIKHIEKTKKIIYNKRKIIQFSHRVDDLILKKLHNDAARELSKRKKLSDLAYWKYNSSAYKYNKDKNRLEFKKELGRSYDVPKYIKLEN